MIRPAGARARVRITALLLLLLIGTFFAPGSAEAKKRPRRKKPASKTKPVVRDFDPRLPILGTRLAALPAGVGKSVAESACLSCHASDLVVQQHLTEKQWTAEVTKMAGWGADVPATRKDELIAYLVKNFGPEAPPFAPVETRPVGR